MPRYHFALALAVVASAAVSTSAQLTVTTASETQTLENPNTDSIGPLPIEVSNLTPTANPKWAIGGGNEQHSRTSWRINGGIGDASAVSFGGLPVRSVLQITGVRTGNGFTVIDTSSSNTAPYVLSAGVNHNLWMEVETFISTLESGDIPRVTVTNEFGQITAFRG